VLEPRPAPPVRCDAARAAALPRRRASLFRNTIGFALKAEGFADGAREFRPVELPQDGVLGLQGFNPALARDTAADAGEGAVLKGDDPVVATAFIAGQRAGAGVVALEKGSKNRKIVAGQVFPLGCDG